MGDLSPNFSRHEFECRCKQYCNGKEPTVDAELIRVLEDVRAYFGNRRITINSGFRCALHNRDEKGSSGSQHLFGKAADIVVEGVPAEQVHYYLSQLHSNKYGIGRYNGRTHIDVRSGGPVRWDER